MYSTGLNATLISLSVAHLVLASEENNQFMTSKLCSRCLLKNFRFKNLHVNRPSKQDFSEQVSECSAVNTLLFSGELMLMLGEHGRNRKRNSARSLEMIMLNEFTGESLAVLTLQSRQR